MKKARKGFTLVELMIVVGIMGILGAMGIIAGQEATSAARAAVIADNLEKLSTAAMMFYEENSEEIDKTGTLDGTTAINAAALAKGINAYLKTDNEVKSAADTDNTYFAIVGTETGTALTWWVGYKFGTSDGNTQVQKAMKNKTNRMHLKTKVDATTDDYNGEATVYMKVRP